MLGIETLKNDLLAITVIIAKVDKALEDNKITFIEWTGLAIELPKVFKIAKNYKDSVAELKDLTEDESQELNAYFAEKFDLKNDVAEAIVEQVLTVLTALASTFLKTKEAEIN